MVQKLSYFWKNRAHYTLVVLENLGRLFWWGINYISAWWWDIKIGKGCRFNGRTYFRRLQDSKIIVGEHCIFNSSHSSNLIGVYSPCIISTLSKIAHVEIGDRCGFSGTVIGAAVSIKIGNDVRCGANTLLTDTDWHSDDKRVGLDKPIIIEDNVWLGYGVKVLKGVRIGKNTLIGANSIVTKDIPSNVIAAGNPCRVIKHIELSL